MSPNLFQELQIDKADKDLGQVDLSLSPPLGLEIIFPSLLSAEVLGKLLYSIHNKLNYLFDYLDYHVVIKEPDTKIYKSTIEEYFSLVCSTPFLWKNKQDLVFFCEQKELLEKFVFQRNIVYLYFLDQQTLSNWKPRLTIFKEILEKLGLSSVRFALKKRDEMEKNKTSAESSSTLHGDKVSLGRRENNQKLSNNPSINSKNKSNELNKLLLLREWKKRKIFELGVHTKFSTLDGISSPSEYVENARQKNYAALAVTDHYNVQSFPEFSKYQSNDLKIIYGCELEMLEDNLPPYIFNHYSEPNQKLLVEKITDLTYCVFDLETTGFFSEYNEIIEIGYVIYQKGEIIREGEHLIRPTQEIAPEILATWYTSIDPQELRKARKINEILPLLQKDWQGCILVAHNARNFDYGFLNKVWQEHFGQELPYPIIDTLPLSWILLPERKSYSLEKLGQTLGRGKITQTHRALDDSKLLGGLLEKLVKILGEKSINYWEEVKNLINRNYFPNRGYKVKILVKNQEGLNNLYRLITISHTKNLFKKPCIFRSDLVKYRKGILVGASGGKEGETFFLFSSFNSEEKRKKSLSFYDYIEIKNPETFRYLWLNGWIREKELKEMLERIIRAAEELNLPLIASHNVHYCEKKEQVLKEIVIANEGINGSRHYLYYEATREEKEDRFSRLPLQHLLSLEEMLDNWFFLNNENLIEKLLFKYPQGIISEIEEVNIQRPPLNYSATESIKGKETDLEHAYTQQANEIFGSKWPEFVQERIKKEWQIIKGRYVFIYWLSYKIVQKTHQDGFLVGSRGSIGSSLIAYLCGITDLNPLPFHKFCQNCKYTELYEEKDRNSSCYDYKEKENCPNCSSLLTMEGNNLPFETFFGWEGEKTPDIDLNFSGEYQKIAHNYIRQLLGEKSVYRIGTISTLSQQTAEIFWKEHIKLRKKVNPDFNEEKWYREWIDEEKSRELQKKMIQLRKEKIQLETELKKIEEK